MDRFKNNECKPPRHCCCSSKWLRIFRIGAAVPFTVTYDPNGGTGGSADGNIPAGSQYTVKTEAAAGVTRVDATFTGWNTAADGSGTAYQPGDDITIAGDLTLYAQWA